MTSLIKFNVLNRFSGDTQFTAEIDCDESALPRIKLGLAVKWAYLRGADLRDAVLSGAVLRGADLSGADLSDAVLRGADLSDADLSDAVLSDAVLRDAVLRGADLSGAVLSDAVLSDAVLSGADLSDAVLRGAVLRGADLSDADLRGADLSDAVLSGADLSDAVLSDAPAIPALDSKIIAAIEAGGKLDMGEWHKCGTTHCRAGWAITLAGEAGAKLEQKLGPAAAGALIYASSYPGLPIPNFYASNETAMADIRSRAATDEVTK